jgi:hypothetical protein
MLLKALAGMLRGSQGEDLQVSRSAATGHVEIFEPAAVVQQLAIVSALCF